MRQDVEVFYVEINIFLSLDFVFTRISAKKSSVYATLRSMMLLILNCKIVSKRQLEALFTRIEMSGNITQCIMIAFLLVSKVVVYP